MSDLFDDGPGNGGPAGRGTAHLSIGRAVAIVGAGVVIGVLLIGVAGRPPAPVTVSAPTTTVPPTTVPPTSTIPATTTTVPHASVKTLVENGTTVTGAAGTYSTFLQQQGWSMISPIDGLVSTAATTTVYYAAGEQPAALEIAQAIGQKPPVVEALTKSAPVQGTAGSDVVVLLGADLASTTPTTTTTG